jgi:hypothetical protein
MISVGVRVPGGRCDGAVHGTARKLELAIHPGKGRLADVLPGTTCAAPGRGQAGAPSIS